MYAHVNSKQSFATLSATGKGNGTECLPTVRAPYANGRGRGCVLSYMSAAGYLQTLVSGVQQRSGFIGMLVS